MPTKKKSKTQYVVLTGLLYNPDNSKHVSDVANFFKEKDWGKLKYKTTIVTQPGRGGEGGRHDVVFAWSGTRTQLGKLSVQRFAMGSNAPHWLEDYIDNNKEIIPIATLKILQELRAW